MKKQIDKVDATPSKRLYLSIIADYDLTFYVDGYLFSGSTTISEQNTSTSWDTKYGTYKNVTKTTYSDTALSGKIQGETYKLYITEWYSYSDFEKGNSIYNHMTIGTSSKSADKTSYSTEYNESTYTETDTSLIREYSKRERENTGIWTEYEMREEVSMDSIENITVPAGTFEAIKITEMDYKNSIYDGKGTTWITEKGVLLRSDQYDDKGNLAMKMV